MIIYGVALLSACLIAGLFMGEVLGTLMGVQANVGGVGMAMLLLALVSGSKHLSPLVKGVSGHGIAFWSALYLPIVVAMAASQNVVAAASGGVLAVLVGVLAVVVSFALVPLLSRIARPMPPREPPFGASTGSSQGA